jgi:LPXTG-motif cell wall-anchored protein
MSPTTTTETTTVLGTTTTDTGAVLGTTTTGGGTLPSTGGVPAELVALLGAGLAGAGALVRRFGRR